jgi:hypothetical protein
MKIYYAIWADAINYERIKNGGGENWKVFTFSYMSILLSFNIITILTLLHYFGYDLTSIIEDWFGEIIQSKAVKDILWTVIMMYIPSMIVTYFSVFYKKKYESILIKNKFRNGKFLIIYAISTAILMFGSFLLNDDKIWN